MPGPSSAERHPLCHFQPERCGAACGGFCSCR